MTAVFFPAAMREKMAAQARASLKNNC